MPRRTPWLGLYRIRLERHSCFYLRNKTTCSAPLKWRRLSCNTSTVIKRNGLVGACRPNLYMAANGHTRIPLKYHWQTHAAIGGPVQPWCHPHTATKLSDPTLKENIWGHPLHLGERRFHHHSRWGFFTVRTRTVEYSKKSRRKEAVLYKVVYPNRSSLIYTTLEWHKITKHR